MCLKCTMLTQYVESNQTKYITSDRSPEMLNQLIWTLEVDPNMWIM